MSKQFYSLLTTKGEQLFSQALASKTPLNITHMAIGDGNGKAITPNKNSTKLAREVYRSTLNSVAVDPRNNKQVIFELTIPENIGNFYIREAGLYDSNNNLIAIANTPESYKPVLTSGSGKVSILQIILAVNSADSVQLTVNNSVVFATREMLAPQKITNSTKNTVDNNGHTHEIDKASTSIAGIVQLVDSLLSNANNMALTAKQGRELKHLIDGLGTPFQNFSATSSLDNTTNLNDLKGTGKYGVYSQSSNSNALTALNYPEQKAGVLFVLPSAYQGIQLYVPFDNQIIYIRRTNQASGFENWRIIGEVIDNLNSDSKTAGLSARQGKLLNENKANKTEVMPLQQASLSDTDDLNDFRQNGIFSQTASARASVEKNYPEATAGILEVLYNGNFQRYTTFNSVCYQRDYRSGKWQDWRRVDSLGKVDRTGDTINGLLRINAQSGWSLLRLGTNQGYWDLEVNPNSESDRRLNLKYTNDSGSSTYIRFPATTVEQNIAYQSWVTEQAKAYVNKSGDTMTGALAISAGDFSKISLLNTQNGKLTVETAPDSYSYSGVIFYEKDNTQKTNIRIPKKSGSLILDSDFTQNLSSNGWTKLPNGLLLMWGNFKTGRIGNEIKGDVIFPIAFPNTAFSVTLSGAHGIISSGGTSWEGFSISELTNAKFQWHSSWQSRSTEQGESKIYWFAIGY